MHIQQNYRQGLLLVCVRLIMEYACSLNIHNYNGGTDRPLKTDSNPYFKNHLLLQYSASNTKNFRSAIVGEERWETLSQYSFNFLNNWEVNYVLYLQRVVVIPRLYKPRFRLAPFILQKYLLYIFNVSRDCKLDSFTKIIYLDILDLLSANVICHYPWF